jgi:hypothetical protein
MLFTYIHLNLKYLILQAARCAICLVLHLEIDSVDRLRTKLYDKKYDLNFPIVNFPCIATFQQYLYFEYISQLIRYFSAYVSYLNFLERWLLLTRKATIMIKFLVYLNQIKNIGWRLTSFDRSRYIQSNLSYRAPLKLTNSVPWLVPLYPLDWDRQLSV